MDYKVDFESDSCVSIDILFSRYFYFWKRPCKEEPDVK